MNCNKMFSLLNEYAPIALSDTLCKIEDIYDNSGIIIGGDEESDGVVFTLDLTEESVKYAIDNGCKIIVTHHPAIYHPIKNLAENSPIRKCAKNGISVISMHLNFDCAKKGIDYYLASGLGGKIEKILLSLGEEVGYGRLSSVNATAGEILNRYKSEFKTEKVMLYGVNNYADIDEEKAKKLAEDLDLLDGLKLSVQHCHEVMDNNKERYPLLEQIYNLLVSKNNDLKEEVKSLQASIAKIKGEQ